MANSVVKSNRLKCIHMQYTVSDYTLINETYYKFPKPTENHNYLFATMYDWGSGSFHTSVMSLTYGGNRDYAYVIVGSVKPVVVYIDFWYYE